MSTNEANNFYAWLMYSDEKEARAAFTDCQCGFIATYRGRKDAKDYLKQHHMHSNYCPSYQDKQKKDAANGK